MPHAEIPLFVHMFREQYEHTSLLLLISRTRLFLRGVGFVAPKILFWEMTSNNNFIPLKKTYLSKLNT
jgi:hypothetical protein